jgi:hypothetical protein
LGLLINSIAREISFEKDLGSVVLFNAAFGHDQECLVIVVEGERSGDIDSEKDFGLLDERYPVLIV